MGMTSAAEAKLNARIRPDIAAMRSRTPYPKRRLSVVPAIAAGSPAAGSPAAGSPDGASPHAGSASVGQAEAGAGQAARAGRAGPPRPAPSRRAVPEGPIRLTRRGRIVVGALVVIAAVVATSLIWLLVASQARAADHVRSGNTTSQALRKVVVRPGQTLWGIAVAADPTADPRAVIQQIIDENELAGTTIQAGQVLWVPRG
jgi:LysM repeat protein